MRLKIFCPPWLIASFCFILAVGNNSEEKTTVKRERAAVYFPALPEAFNENFGKKSSRRSGFSKSLNENSPPISSPKPITTTEKLPLAQESHYARKSVTEVPGPSYLTESVYYQKDPTPSPSSDEEFSINAKEHSLEEREREDIGVLLQSVSSFKPHFNGNRIILDPLINPASMHYIPIESEESANETPSEKIPSSLPFKPSSDISAFSADEFSILVKTVPASKIEEPTPPPRHFSESVQQPFVNYSVSFRNQRVKHTTTTTTTTTERPVRLYVPPSKPKKVEFSRSRNSNSKPTFDVIKSKGFLPKPARNPFAVRISQPAIKSSYESPIISNSVPFPSTTTTTTTSPSVPFPSKTSEERVPDYATNFSKKKSNAFQHSFLSFGERKQKRIKPVEVRVSPSTKSPESLFEQIRRDYGFDFSSASITAPRKELKKSSASSTPIEEAPVYHTSTKSYRAPSSLFQIRDSKGKSVTAPSQPDFIQTESNIYIPQEYDEEAIPGMAGIDYPIYDSIPETNFACINQDHPGLYADQQTKCQVFHICQEGGREDSFLCPNGTVFNQQYFVCDWWYNFSCESADRFYSLNALIYEFSDDTERKPMFYS